MREHWLVKLGILSLRHRKSVSMQMGLATEPILQRSGGSAMSNRPCFMAAFLASRLWQRAALSFRIKKSPKVTLRDLSGIGNR